MEGWVKCDLSLVFQFSTQKSTRKTAKVDNNESLLMLSTCSKSRGKQFHTRLSLSSDSGKTRRWVLRKPREENSWGHPLEPGEEPEGMRTEVCLKPT